MHYLRVLIIAVSGGLLALLLASSAFGQRVYSYVDENGVRVFTNIPPKNAPSVEPASDGLSKNSDRKDLQRITHHPQDKGQVNRIIEKYADQYRLDPQLVHSIIASESGFNAGAVSRKGAQGLMQLMPGTASRLGVRNPMDPEENIRGGMAHLRTLLDTFNNDLPLSLAAYNAGENLVQRIRRVPDYPETKAYVRTVTSRYGSKELVLQRPSSTPRYFKFVDPQGILHLTNIATPQRSEPEAGAWGLPTQSPE
jgi:soluble lytic murein transglycosylase-like protein